MQRTTITQGATSLAALAILLAACGARPRHPTTPPPADPIANIAHQELHARGIAFARTGDFIRAEQYLRAALEKGHRDTKVVPQLIRVCVAASRLRAAAAYAAPYLEQHPDDTATRTVLATIQLALGEQMAARDNLQRVLTNERSNDLVKQHAHELLAQLPQEPRKRRRRRRRR